MSIVSLHPKLNHHSVQINYHNGLVRPEKYIDMSRWPLSYFNTPIYHADSTEAIELHGCHSATWSRKAGSSTTRWFLCYWPFRLLTKIIRFVITIWWRGPCNHVFHLHSASHLQAWHLPHERGQEVDSPLVSMLMTISSSYSNMTPCHLTHTHPTPNHHPPPPTNSRLSVKLVEHVNRYIHNKKREINLAYLSAANFTRAEQSGSLFRSFPHQIREL